MGRIIFKLGCLILLMLIIFDLLAVLSSAHFIQKDDKNYRVTTGNKKMTRGEPKPKPFCPCGRENHRIHKRVVGGRDADSRDFPYIVGLVLKSAYAGGNFQMLTPFCGAILVTEKHLISAAHCLYGRHKNDMFANIGDYDIYLTNETTNFIRQIKSILIHEDYIDQTFNNDIAILELDEAVTLNRRIRTACLPPKGTDLKPGTIVTVAGWGRVKYEGLERPHILQQVDIPVIGREECQKPLQHHITDNMICAGGEEGKDACLGDSGGGLMVPADDDYALCGLVSYGKKCALPNIAGVYTRVSLYIDWIHHHARNADCITYVVPKEKYPSSE